MSFDVETFVADCLDASRESQPRLAMRDVVERALADCEALADALPPVRAGITALHVSDELTILNVVWAPGMKIRPHDHRTWATIGIFTGGEDNRFFRRAGGSIVESGGTQLRRGELCLLGDDTIHTVHNPTTEHTGAIHIYGGNFFTLERSEWNGPPWVEEAYDHERTRAFFDAANR